MSDQNSLGLERLTLLGAVRQASSMEMLFSTSQNWNPQRSACPYSWSMHSELLRVPLSEGWGKKSLFNAPRPCFPKHSKDSNWPFSYRVTVLFWPLNSISRESSIPELVFQVGWPHGKSLSGETSGCLFRLPSRRVRSRFNSYWYNPQLWMNISFLQMSWKCSEVGLARWCWWNCIWV